MAGAHYTINQAANDTPTGTEDVARVDIWQSQLMHFLGDSTDGQTLPVWTIIAWPFGSARQQPTNPTTFDATYTPDVPGSYRVEYLVDSGVVDDRNVFIFRVTRNSTGLIIDAGLAEPAFGEAVGEDTSASNDRGYARTYELAMTAEIPTADDRDILRTMMAHRHTQVHLLGLVTKGDGNGGLFYWDAASTTADDDTDVLAPTGLATGRWIRTVAAAAPSGTGIELEPSELILKQVTRQNPFDVQPTALLQFADDMSVTTLTRFTQLSEGTPVTPTIASNLMTFNMSGGDKNNLELEGSAIIVPQFMSTVRISSVTHTGADTNTYENIGVGLCKDSNNFMYAIWRRKEGTYGHVAIQVKVSGASNWRGDITLSAALTTPFDIGLSLVANSLTLWQKPNGGAWTKLSSWTLTEIDMKTTTLTGWKPALAVACQAAVQVSSNLTNFNFGSFGMVGFRDPVLFSNEDGSPYLPSGDTVKLTATCVDPQAAAYCGVFTLDLVTYTLTQVGVIFVDRGGTKQNDNAAHVIYYNDTSSRLFITSWGSTGAANIQIYYKLNSVGVDVATGVNLIASMAQLALPNITAGGGTYDPYVIKISSNWYMAHTIGPSVAQTFFPSLASSTDLSTWTSVGSDVSAFPFEGTRIVQLNGSYWILCANVNQTNVYDITMNYVGIMKSPFTLPSGGYPPHPMLVAHGDYVYDITFDNTLYFAVANTMGWFREFRARRYGLFP